MSRRLSRRQFVKAGAVAGIAAAARRTLAQGPAVVASRGARPIVISSRNGNEFKNGGPHTAVEEAYGRIARGEDVLDAILAGVNIVELDPLDDSVGYGGIPNAEGVVQLDSCVMHGPSRRAGGVGALEGVRTPSLVARAVMASTDHHLLVGAGAQWFARAMGFTVEPDLNTEHSRKLWLEWKRRTDPEHYPAVSQREARDAMIAEGLLHADRLYGTIHMNAVNAKGEVCGATTTSGLAFKIPGRLGDSPILGAGNYVDGDVGACGSTGRGEANLYNLSSFFVVEQMRQGKSPKDAIVETLKRIKERTVKRLQKPDGNPNFDIKFYAMNVKGEHAGISMYGGAEPKYAVCDENGPKTIAMDALFSGKPD
ncbi:MAG TPA: N(4)-(beta-N-acetylglucosaminyl)-L-asparaginase [Candidatus Polarisedimenticolaceae bacterium]|nr:N(4)-(beta-N-acetylglucosaminyl)-L-asparaginase [Candidatus Polarisedimenticolaceae bacterium]